MAFDQDTGIRGLTMGAEIPLLRPSPPESGLDEKDLDGKPTIPRIDIKQQENG
jgi:hypothetical protein